MSRASEMVGAGFVHLHVRSAYSLLEGAMKVGKIADLAKADGMAAVAITDTSNLFGALEFSEKLAGAGIQPIVGVSLAVDFADREEGPDRRLPHLRRLPRLILLAQSEAGYANLMALSSMAYGEAGAAAEPHLAAAVLAERAEGVIALTGGPGGPLDVAFRDGQPALAAERAALLAQAFADRLYVEIQRHGTEEERRLEPFLLDLAYARGLPLVATNECYFAARSDHESHDALLAIAEGRILAETERRRLTPQHYFKSRAEMRSLFADLPEAVDATVEIARRCAFRARTRKPILPRFSVGTGTEPVDEAGELRRQAGDGLAARLAAHGTAAGRSEGDYRQRLEFELSIIEKMKFPGYFLIVSDFIKHAKSKGIPVGPGRGSGAGSLVAYALTITDLDPLRFSLLFERFLNPERISMPDFDVDFCQDRRDEVIRYVQEKYGADRVAQIITFGSLQARGVMRDVGRVLEMSYGQVDKLCKLVPQNPANPVTLAKAIEDEPKLREAAQADPVVERMLTIAKKLEGLYRHASTHAAGVVIGDRPLTELVPLYHDPKTAMPMPATQFNMKWVEPAGLVKFDFLGLKTLTVLQRAVNFIAQRGIGLDLAALPLDDDKTYQMLARGETVGVFQVESQGMRRALVDMHADRFEDIIALVALYRPGPMANIPVYNARKNGREDPDYMLDQIKPALEETYGVIIYQEQVMQIAQILSGYTLGEADMLRRAMGKKIKAEMDAQRARFVTGAVERGIAKAKADEIFDYLAKFADYGFNKSHAAAYALLTYQTAWLKANHPVEFMAASMSLDISNTDKLAEFRLEARRLGIKVEPPSINRSGPDFEVHDGAIRYALGAVKGVGMAAMQRLIEIRGAEPFFDLADFARRLDPRAVNKRMLESLTAAGAFDELDPDRARVAASIDAIMALAQRAEAEKTGGQSDMFGGASRPEPLKVNPVEPWEPADKLQREFDAVGFFLSGHPLDAYAAVLGRLQIPSWVQFTQKVKQGASAGRLAATVLSRSERRTKTGSKMGIIMLSDASGQFESVIFSEGLAQYRDLLEPGTPVLLTVQAAQDGEDVRARIVTAERLDDAAAKNQRGIRVFLRGDQALDSVARRLGQRGEAEVSFVLQIEEGRREVEVRLPGRFQLSPQITSAIKAIPGVMAVQQV
ncbi:DNA polymerase III subunit alpha [Labrys wisconsinensis]|uniref:DNA polymerase III subunit alpha n=1 Tax=Labrys wisconsinensis TaxID=425677 RepID=A0ABU0J4Y0_9HYPH|nr:DNA polymerase III subunit alpha [Labrys wisconsinensis]MDQ0469316.1 DNA polymerase-3 subunit alpha [Labrys wisconsinensis]